MRLKTAIASLVVGIWAPFALAQARPIPPLSGPVIDEARLLSPNERMRLEQELRAYPPAVQLQVWIVSSLQGEPIESVSIRATDAWKLGTSKDDRGALLLIAVEDRRSRLEVGQGLEGDITDLQSNRIVDGTLRNAFRDGRFYEGLRDSAREIYALAGGTDAAFRAPERRPRGEPISSRMLFLIVLILVIANIFRGRGPGGRARRYGAFGTGVWVGGRGARGWGGGGFGGGGGWSGGGGGFSGGGSSGSW